MKQCVYNHSKQMLFVTIQLSKLDRVIDWNINLISLIVAIKLEVTEVIEM